MPCKTRVAELVDELSDAAKLIGACNTVVVKDGKSTAITQTAWALSET